jgi:hypothetical protein
MPGGLGSSDQSARVRQLESLVNQYKSELDSQSRDSRDLEDKIAQGQGLVKSSLLTESQDRITTLETQIQGLEQTLQEVQVANTTLDAEVNDLMRRVASGEYNPKRERVLELQSNPAGKMMAIRNQVLEDLKRENEVLIERLRATTSGASGAGGGGEGAGLIPKESWDRLCKEKRDMEKAHEKRLMRLKEVSLLSEIRPCFLSPPWRDADSGNEKTISNHHRHLALSDSERFEIIALYFLHDGLLAPVFACPPHHSVTSRETSFYIASPPIPIILPLGQSFPFSTSLDMLRMPR